MKSKYGKITAAAFICAMLFFAILFSACGSKFDNVLASAEKDGKPILLYLSATG